MQNAWCHGMTATPFLLKTSKEFKADRDGKNQSACGHKKILYRNIICQRAEKGHTQRQRAGSGDLHETENPAMHAWFHFFLDGYIDGGVVAGGGNAYHGIHDQVYEKYRRRPQTNHDRPVHTSGQKSGLQMVFKSAPGGDEDAPRTMPRL